MNILDYLGTNITDDWQLMYEDKFFNVVMVVAPRTGNINDLKNMVNMDLCSIYVVLSEECNIVGLDCIYKNGPNEIPAVGFHVSIGKYLTPEPYMYGVVHKIS